MRQGIDGHVKAVLIEPHYTCKDFRNLFSQFYSKKFLDRPSHCSRLHFFSADVTVGEVLEATDACKGAYVGYTVVQPVRERCLGRTYIDPFRIGQSLGSFYCLRTPSEVHVNGVTYTVEGYPYSSQSKEATVCTTPPSGAFAGICPTATTRTRSFIPMT